jgi:hypothetical protein
MDVACGLRGLLIAAAPDLTALKWEVSGRQWFNYLGRCGPGWGMFGLR